MLSLRSPDSWHWGAGGGSPHGVIPTRWDARGCSSMGGCEVERHSGTPAPDHFAPDARDQHVRVLDSPLKFSSRKTSFGLCPHDRSTHDTQRLDDRRGPPHRGRGADLCRRHGSGVAHRIRELLDRRARGRGALRAGHHLSQRRRQEGDPGGGHHADVGAHRRGGACGDEEPAGADRVATAIVVALAASAPNRWPVGHGIDPAQPRRRMAHRFSRGSPIWPRRSSDTWTRSRRSGSSASQWPCGSGRSRTEPRSTNWCTDSSARRRF